MKNTQKITCIDEYLEYYKYKEGYIFSLILSNNMISNLETTWDLSDLLYLNISSTEITNLNGIEKFIDLRELDCSGTKIKSLLGIEKIPKLERIYFHRTSFYEKYKEMSLGEIILSLKKEKREINLKYLLNQI